MPIRIYDETDRYIDDFVGLGSQSDGVPLSISLDQDVKSLEQEKSVNFSSIIEM